MSAPRAALVDYLQRQFPDAALRPMVGDASTRRFWRVELRDGSTRVLMDYGAPFSGETDDIRLTRLFEVAALRVPRILGISPTVGCLLLEDLGTTTLESAFTQEGGIECGRSPELLRHAVVLAREISVRGSEALRASTTLAPPALDSERFRFEMDFFQEHFLNGLLGRGPAPGALVSELHNLAEQAAETPRRVLCHRDFHSRNLMVLADGSLAMVDIQDARWGPDSYDLASLLCDAYVDLSRERALALVEEYRAALPDPPARKPFSRRFDLVAAQRMLKALGTFGFQATTRGQSRYLEGVPRTLVRLHSLLQSRSETVGLFALLDKAGLFTSELPGR